MRPIKTVWGRSKTVLSKIKAGGRRTTSTPTILTGHGGLSAIHPLDCYEPRVLGNNLVGRLFWGKLRLLVLHPNNTVADASDRPRFNGFDGHLASPHVSRRLRRPKFSRLRIHLARQCAQGHPTTPRGAYARLRFARCGGTLKRAHPQFSKFWVVLNKRTLHDAKNALERAKFYYLAAFFWKSRMSYVHTFSHNIPV